MKHRHNLPQLDGGLFLTTQGSRPPIFHGPDLRRFAAFDLLKHEGTETMRRYFEPYAELARDHGLGFVRAPPGGRVPIGRGDRLFGRRVRRSAICASQRDVSWRTAARPEGPSRSAGDVRLSSGVAAGGAAKAVRCAGGGAVNADRVATETLEPRRNR